MGPTNRPTGNDLRSRQESDRGRQKSAQPSTPSDAGEHKKGSSGYEADGNRTSQSHPFEIIDALNPCSGGFQKDAIEGRA